jgi:hypothetical protein
MDLQAHTDHSRDYRTIKWKKLTSKILMDYSLSSKYGSKMVTNHSNVLINSPIKVLSMIP